MASNTHGIAADIGGDLFANMAYSRDNGGDKVTPRCANSRGRGRTTKEPDVDSVAYPRLVREEGIA